MENTDKAWYIMVELLSRPNATNGKYNACQLGLDDLGEFKNDIFFLESLQLKANLADKIIAEAESQGKDTTDLNVLRDLGEEINAKCKPLHRSESIMTAIFVSLHLMVYYGIAIGIWGLVFKKSFLGFGFYGVITGLLISLLSAAPVVAFQRTKERIRAVVEGVGIVWVTLVKIIGVLGIIAWIIRTVFFLIWKQ